MRQERFPHHRLQKKSLVSDPGMHHGMCVTHISYFLILNLKIIEIVDVVLCRMIHIRVHQTGKSVNQHWRLVNQWWRMLAASILRVLCGMGSMKYSRIHFLVQHCGLKAYLNLLLYEVVGGGVGWGCGVNHRICKMLAIVFEALSHELLIPFVCVCLRLDWIAFV